jgi:hypothetical protein
MWFRRRDRRRTHTPFDESTLPARSFLTVAEAVDEGLLLTEYACRMAVKNRFLIRVLAGHGSWDPIRGREIARDTLRALAAESDTDAENLDRLISSFRDRPAPEEDSHGYTRDDLPNMEHRRDVSRGVAKRLRDQSDDETFLDGLVDAARSDAWREVASNIENKLGREHVAVDAEYLRNRQRRLRRLIDVDLAELLAGSEVEAPPTEYGAL